MKHFSLFLLLFPCFNLHGQHAIEWQKKLGGTRSERGTCLIPTADGGSILIANSQSNDGDLTFNHNIESFDVWVVKLTASGAIEWQKCLGGSDYEYGKSIRQTPDGGYILVGSTYSNDGDLFLIKEHQGQDCWVIKLTSSGQLQWTKTYGTDDYDTGTSIHQTPDGGYMVAGSSKGSYWLFKINASGTMLWERHYGGSEDDQLVEMQPTSDNGCILTGSSWSVDGNVTGHHGSTVFADYWVVKTDSAGSTQWQRSLGGVYLEQSNHVVQTADGGYVVSGFSTSNNGDVSGHHGSIGSSSDPWIVKLSGSGQLQWQKSLGGTNDDAMLGVFPTPDGDVVLAGMAVSTNGTIPAGGHGNGDAWILKMGMDGSTKWQQLFGGTEYDQMHVVIQTPDGGYLICGYAGSTDGDVTAVGHGFGEDIWLVKLGPISGTVEEARNTLHLYPNPSAGSIHLVADENDPLVTVVVSDLLGRQLLQQNLAGAENLETASLPAGTYLIRGETKSGKSLLGKFVKQ